MNAREAILATLRQRLNRPQALEKSVQTGLDARGKSAVPGPQPVWDENPLERFVARSEAVQASVEFVTEPAAIPQAVIGYLNEQSQPLKLIAAPHPYLQSIPWSPELNLSWRPAEAGDEVALGIAYAGIAESGTLALLSSSDSPASGNFLPSLHLVILQRERIVRQQEDLWALLEAESTPMPRALNLITGPSKTGDVEQTIVYGAHGPGRLHVLIIG